VHLYFSYVGPIHFIKENDFLKLLSFLTLVPWPLSFHLLILVEYLPSHDQRLYQLWTIYYYPVSVLELVYLWVLFAWVSKILFLPHCIECNAVLLIVKPSVRRSVKRLHSDKTKAPSEKKFNMTNRKSTKSSPAILRWTAYIAPKPPMEGLKNAKWPFRIKVDLSCKNWPTLQRGFSATAELLSCFFTAQYH